MKNYRSTMNTLTQVVGVLMVFLLIFPTALVNVALFLFVMTYILGGNYRNKWQQMRENPVAIASLALFVLFAIGTSYSSVSLREALLGLNHYRELLLLPLAISVFNDDCWRRRAYYAFFTAMVVALMVSFSMRMGLIAQNAALGEEWVPFKSRIAYSFFLALTIYLAAHHLLRSKVLQHSLAWGAVGCMAVFSLLFMISGRTGQAIFAVLVLLLVYQYWQAVIKHRAVFLATLAIVVSAMILSFVAITSRSSDVELAMSNPESSSIGQRLIMWQTTTRVIADHPWLGTGTGGFAKEYAQKAFDHPSFLATNPHNEYLLIMAQLGVLGLAVFLWLLYKQWKESAALKPPYDFAAQGLVLGMAVGCLFNSFLFDHGEGHFFAIYAGMLFSGLDKSQHKISS